MGDFCQYDHYFATIRIVNFRDIKVLENGRSARGNLIFRPFFVYENERMNVRFFDRQMKKKRI